MSDDPEPGTPPTVVAAIAAGVAPAPFLATYAVLFLLHGTVFPVDPPDVTGSHAGEALAGLVALAFLVANVLGLAWLLSRRTRWLFLLGQLAALAASVDFVVDSTAGRPEVPFVLALASGSAVVLGCVPPSWRWIEPRRPQPVPDEPAPPVVAAPADPDGPVDPNPGSGFGASTPWGA